MTVIQSIQFFVFLNLFTIGLSHFFQPKIWIDFFQFLYKKGNIGNIINALIALAMGSIILSFHFIWKWPHIIITLYGTSQLLKGLLYLTIPKIGLKSLSKVDSNSQKFRWAGLIMSLLSFLILFQLINENAFNF